MKKFFILFFLTPCLTFGQVIENFDDGDFTSNPPWVGDVASWQVITGQLNSNHQIASSSFYLSTASTQATDAQWEIWVNFKQATSGVNYMDIYLISDIQDLNGTGNGYFVRIGGTDDEISLYKKTAGSVTEVIDGTDDRSEVNSSNNYFKIKVTRTASNLWTLYDDNIGGNNFFTEGTVIDASFTTSVYFGISVTQSTSSFFNKHYFDSINVGNIVIDVTPPAVSNMTVISQNQVDVTFNEAVEQSSAETESNYTVNNGIGNPSSSIRDVANQSLVHLNFVTNFASGITNTLSVVNVQDLNFNAISTASTGQFTYFTPVTPSKYDLVITEFMPDPNPTIGLPDEEYIEIYNRSNKTFDLNGWKISDSGSPTDLTSFILTPNSYLILCSTSNVPLFASFGNVLGVSSFPSLNNAADGGNDDIIIYDNNSAVIDKIHYDETYYNDPLRNDGGFSIERVDPDFTCANYLNWKASQNNAGGTPGTINSVDGIFTDTQAPILLRALVIDSTHVKVFFDEPMTAIVLASASTYSIDNSIGVPISVSTAADFASATLTTSTNILKAVIYTLTVSSSISDCAGNVLSGNNFVRFAIPDSAEISDILINEILFNPKDDGVDFVELYNRSEKVIDLSSMRIANTNLATDSLDDVQVITNEGFLIFPGDYIVLTESPSIVKTQYNTTNPAGFAAVVSMPSFNDDEDKVVITNSDFTRLDQFHYSEDYHFPLLNDPEGVSLERISFSRPTQDSTNWHSAAETVGFATPAYENSQHAETIDDGSEVSIEPEIFSPDNDGLNDVVNILYHFDAPGYTANLKIFDSKGRLIIHLVKNQLLGTEAGSFAWDGINDENEKSKTGIYVAYLEVFNTDGKVKKFKKPLVVASKL